jgi:hypothetical protein
VAEAARGLLVALLALAGAGTAGAAPIAFLVAEKPGAIIHGDSYILVLEADADVAHARALVAGGPGAPPETIVVADIFAGADGVNRDPRAPGAPLWSWHVAELTEFAESTIELCDGWPGQVEADVADWIGNTGGQICFWSYTVVEELPEPGQGVLLAAGAALLLALRLKRGAEPSDTVPRMRATLHVAGLLLALFALQAGASVAASAAGPCCPAMAAAGPDTPPPCRTLSAVGCCEERSGAPSAEAFAPPAPALLAPAAPAPVVSERPGQPRGAAPGDPAARALRTTILRL